MRSHKARPSTVHPKPEAVFTVPQSKLGGGHSLPVLHDLPLWCWNDENMDRLIDWTDATRKRDEWTGEGRGGRKERKNGWKDERMITRTDCGGVVSGDAGVGDVISCELWAAAAGKRALSLESWKTIGMLCGHQSTSTRISDLALPLYVVRVYVCVYVCVLVSVGVCVSACVDVCIGV